MKPLTPTAAMGNECKALAAELLKQPELLAGVFEDSVPALPESQQVVQAAKQYTGERSTIDDQRLLMVGALHLLGASDREIERSCGVTRRTIPVLLAELERTGRVTPLKERLTQQVSVLAERAGRTLAELLNEVQDGKRTVELAAMVKSVGQVHSFQVEKYQLLTGQATERIEVVAGVGRAEIEQFLKDCATPVESESTGFQQESQENGANTPTDTRPDTTSAAPSPESSPAPGDDSGGQAGGGSPEGGHGGTPMV